MNKTVSINLSGIVFQIDEHAYTKLNNYLESVKTRFSQTEGSDEIISDIEARIAEMFSEKVNATKQVITMDDVESMINLMGRPEDFEDAGEDEATSGSTSQRKRQSKSKRLYRDEEESVIGGVCAGLSAYLGIDDPIWMRLVFIAVTLAGGWGIPIYIILWIIVPKAETASQRLEMRGEDVNISNIEKTFSEGADDVKKKFSEIRSGQAATQAKTGVNRLLALAASAFEVVFKVLVKILGVVFILFGGKLLITCFLMILAALGIVAAGLPEVFRVTFMTGWQSILGITGLILLIAIPAIALIYFGLRILFGHTMQLRGAWFGLSSAWFLGWIFFFVGGTFMAAQFSSKTGPKENLEIAQPAGNILYLQQLYNPHESEWEQDEGMFGTLVKGVYLVDEQIIMADQVELDIVKSNSGNFELIESRTARGRTKAQAADRAEGITYEISQQDSLVSFSNLVSFQQDDQWRMQKVELTLKVPVGKSVFLGDGMYDIIYDIKNTTNTWDGHMIGHTWEMRPKGLTCTDCEFGKENWDTDENHLSQSYPISDFDAVDVAGAFNINITHGIDYKVTIKAEPNDLEHIKVEKRGRTLSIEPDRNLFKLFDRGFYRHVVINITSPNLEEVEFSGATNAEVSGFEVEAFRADVSGASECELSIDADDIELEVSGASSLSLRGNGSQLTADVSGASEFTAHNYACHNVDVELSGASDGSVHAIKELIAEVSGASDLHYQGNPEIDSDVSGFSSIKPMH